MCTNAASDINNALHQCAAGDSAPTILLEFSPYMNWGRWNHNTSRIQPMIEKLVAGGVNVQLKHDATETSWEVHGWVSLSLDGVELCRSEDVQHNRGYGTRMEKMDTLVATALSAVTAAAGGKPAGGAAAAEDAAVASSA